MLESNPLGATFSFFERKIDETQKKNEQMSIKKRIRLVFSISLYLNDDEKSDNQNRNYDKMHYDYF